MSQSLEHEGWIYIVSQGKNQIASPEYVKQKILGICTLKAEINSLLERVYQLEGAGRQEQILELLKRDGGKHTEKWFQSRVPPSNKSKYWDLDSLVVQGKVSKEWHGTQVVYFLVALEAQK